MLYSDTAELLLVYFHNEKEDKMKLSEFLPTDTVNNLISAVSNFRSSMKMAYWRILILAAMIYHGPDDKENLM